MGAPTRKETVPSAAVDAPSDETRGHDAEHCGKLSIEANASHLRTQRARQAV